MYCPALLYDLLASEEVKAASSLFMAETGTFIKKIEFASESRIECQSHQVCINIVRDDCSAHQNLRSLTLIVCWFYECLNRFEAGIS
uniref:Uncharacterized protein n=1 Tax=Ascaris lumbricoides TaxID=6252 RepID=A0A0M3I0W7_ASCLU